MCLLMDVVVRGYFMNLATFQSFTVLSKLPEAIRLLSGEMETPKTLSVWPVRVDNKVLR